MKTISLGEELKSFNTLEYLEIIHCENLETISWGIEGCMYLNVVLEYLPSLLTIEWIDSCFLGNEACRGWDKYKKKMSEESSARSNRSSNIGGPVSKRRKMNSLEANFEIVLSHVGYFGYRAEVGALVMNSKFDVMFSFKTFQISSPSTSYRFVVTPKLIRIPLALPK